MSYLTLFKLFIICIGVSVIFSFSALMTPPNSRSELICVIFAIVVGIISIILTIFAHTR